MSTPIAPFSQGKREGRQKGGAGGLLRNQITQSCQSLDYEGKSNYAALYISRIRHTQLTPIEDQPYFTDIFVGWWVAENFGTLFDIVHTIRI